MPIANAKTAKPTCQPKFSSKLNQVNSPETTIAEIAAMVEKLRTELKTRFAPFTGLVYEPP